MRRRRRRRAGYGSLWRRQRWWMVGGCFVFVFRG